MDRAAVIELGLVKGAGEVFRRGCDLGGFGCSSPIPQTFSPSLPPDVFVL